MVNLMLEARARYLLYIIVNCIHDHHTVDSLVWSSFRLAPITISNVLYRYTIDGECGVARLFSDHYTVRAKTVQATLLYAFVLVTHGTHKGDNILTL